MKKLFKRNQIVITVLAVMIAVAGYIQCTGQGFLLTRDTKANSDDVLLDISDEDIYANQIQTEEALAVNDEVPIEGTPGEAVLANSNSVDKTTELKLNREQVRSKNKEALMEIINSTSVDEKQKEVAITKMVQMTEYAYSELAAETLLEAKGFNGAVVTITNDSVDVVINSENVTDEQRAQIEDIVKRKTNISADKIVISTLANK